MTEHCGEFLCSALTRPCKPQDRSIRATSKLTAFVHVCLGDALLDQDPVSNHDERRSCLPRDVARRCLESRDEMALATRAVRLVLTLIWFAAAWPPHSRSVELTDHAID